MYFPSLRELVKNGYFMVRLMGPYGQPEHKIPVFLTRSLKVGQLSAVRSEHAVAEVPLQAIAAFCDFSLKIIDEELLIKS